MQRITNSYGLVVCGGKSERMGSDKGMLTYHHKPQRYHAYDMLAHCCDRTFLSCNASQGSSVSKGYDVLPDAPLYNEIGPMAALLTAFQKFPEKDFLFIGCDYPLLTSGELNSFTNFCEGLTGAAAFYHQPFQIYEPLLAWYPHETYPTLLKQFDNKVYSLQHFLRRIEAAKYQPSDSESMRSIDSREGQNSVRVQLTTRGLTIE